MRVYLAGPMTGYPALNFPAFDEATADLRDRGIVVYSPAEVERAGGFNPAPDEVDAPDSHADYMADDLPHVCTADAVVVLPGWEASRGARIEVGVAVALGLPILAYPDLLRLEVEAPAPRVREAAPAVVVDGRERVVDPATGGVKERKPARFDLLPWDCLWEVAEHYGRGADKYDAHNWARGYAWSLSIGAAGRHLAAIAAGEDIDAENGTPHAAALAFHALALLRFRREFPHLDDRHHVDVRPWAPAPA